MLRKTLLTSVLTLVISTAWAQSPAIYNQRHEGNRFATKTSSHYDTGVKRDKPVLVTHQDAHLHTERINGATPPQAPYLFAGSKPQFSSTTRVGWHIFLGYTYIRNLVTY